MRTVVIVTLLCLSAGCAKKTAKSNGRVDDARAPQPVSPNRPERTPDGHDPKQPRANWLTDPRADTKNQLPAENRPPKPDLGVKLPRYDTDQVLPAAPVAPAAPAGGRAGEIQPQPAAPPANSSTRPAFKPVTKADMNEVWVFIENASGASGKMPPAAVVYAALVQAEAKAADLVKDGSIFLTGATTRESVWAFETRALTQGGWVASQNGVENLTADELKRRLGR